MNQIGYFEIQASDPARLVEFYRNVFGWEIEKADGLPVEYYRIKNSSDVNAGSMGGLLKRPTKTPPMEYGTNAYTCSIEVADFDNMSKVIIENEGKVAMPKFAVPGRCWQGYFIDPDNNVFGIFEVDPNAK